MLVPRTVDVGTCKTVKENVRYGKSLKKGRLYQESGEEHECTHTRQGVGVGKPLPFLIQLWNRFVSNIMVLLFINRQNTRRAKVD